MRSIQRNTTGNNRLEHANSAYLRGAATQPVDWYPWGKQAFERAVDLDRPILLDIGAVWCHWCHVMDHESYEDPATAAIINKHFVAVKVDRDERPDVDARYQKRVASLTGQGGWPLTAFLTSRGDVFWGGTYFPPEAGHGRPGFRDVLLATAQAYEKQRAKVLDQATAIGDHVRRHVHAGTASAQPLGKASLDAQLNSCLKDVDHRHGGWGSAPKFPHPSAVEFLLRFAPRGDASAWATVEAALDAMAKGGIHDHVGGGFHRYSVDAAWHVPHFEKMLYDNAELLGNYAQAQALAPRAHWGGAIGGVLRFLLGTLQVGDGGFGGSQDADVGPDDDGDYFTWTADEVRDAVADPVRRDVLGRFFGVADVGPMHHNRSKNVLHAALSVREVAAAQQRPLPDVERDLERGVAELRAARLKRTPPFVDPTRYVSWNALAIRALFLTSRLHNHPEAETAATKAMEGVLGAGWSGSAGFRHVLGDPASVATVDDQAHMLGALVEGFVATGNSQYLEHAKRVDDVLLHEYWDADAQALRDRASGAQAEAAVLGDPEYPLDDSPSASANARAAEGWLRLDAILGVTDRRGRVESLLSRHASAETPKGVFGAGLYAAHHDVVHGVARAVVVGGNLESRARLLDMARRTLPFPGVVVDASTPGTDVLPQVQAYAQGSDRNQAAALLCIGQSCGLPAHTQAQWATQLGDLGFKGVADSTNR